MIIRALAISASLLLASYQTATAQAPTSTTAQADVRVYVMYCGDLGVGDTMDLRKFYGKDIFKTPMVTMSNPCFVIKHPKGILLWDTGVPMKQLSTTSKVAFPETLDKQLASIGMKVSDVKYLSFSHGHWDHLGQANLFVNSTWLVDPVERAFMFNDTNRKAEIFPYYADLEKAKSVTEITGDYDVYGDGSVVIVSTPGHSPAHRSLLVRLKKSPPLLLSGDLFHSGEARDMNAYPERNFDKPKTASSMEKFNEIAKANGARVVIQHEMNDYKALPHAPAYLE